MKNAKKVAIFDMDGTLYQFSGGSTFLQSPFGRAIQQNVRRLIANEFGLDGVRADERYRQLYAQFSGEMSLALEREAGIKRVRFFDETWNLDPAEFIVVEPGLREALLSIGAEPALLSAAPRVWVDRALGYMGIADVFGDRIFTGEPDIRKPSPLAFQQVLDDRRADAAYAISIGDQDPTDIIPAQLLGMATVRIGAGETVADLQAATVVDAIALLRERNVL